MRTVAALAALACLSTACGSDDGRAPGADSTTSTAESPSTSGDTTTPSSDLDDDTPIGATGIGPLEAGMTLAEVRDAVAPRQLVIEGFEDFEGYCWLARVEGLEEDFSLLFLAPERTTPVDDPDEGELGRVSAYGDSDESPAATTGGPGVGSTKDEVREAYGSGHAIEVTPHEYAEGGEYIDVTDRKHDDGLLLRFETDGSGTVTAVHGGLEDAAKLSEGCA